MIIFISFLGFKMKKVIKSTASNKARIIVSGVVNEAILNDMAENKPDYSEIITLGKNDAGEVMALSSDIEKINRLKAHINLVIQKEFCNLKAKEFFLPLGTLTGIEILNCKGPQVPLKISSSGNVSTELVSDFVNGGINQTLHRINLFIHTRVSVLVTGCSCVFESDNKILVSETVIVGKVPNLYGGSISNGTVSTSGSENKN